MAMTMRVMVRTRNQCLLQLTTMATSTASILCSSLHGVQMWTCMQYCIYHHKVIEYVTKYTTKSSEPHFLPI